MSDRGEPYRFSSANDRQHKANWEGTLAEPDPVEREKLIRDAFRYRTCQFHCTAGPVRTAYVFREPRLNGYQGSRLQDYLQAEGKSPTWARVWTDQDLRFEMTGTLDQGRSDRYRQRRSRGIQGGVRAFALTPPLLAGL